MPTHEEVKLTRPIIGIENRTPQEVFDIMCDRIRSAEQARAPSVGVKPLEWQERHISPNEFYAITIMGSYFAYPSGGWTSPWGHHVDEGGIASAKAAAQADYETRIRSALTSASAVGEARLAEAVKIITSFIEQEVDYMTINKLGDPEKQHNVKWGRAFLREKMEWQEKYTSPDTKRETYYSKGKDAEYFERLPNKEFSWALTCASQDLNDSDENVSAWMPVSAMLNSAADRISAAPVQPINIDYLRETLTWVRRNFAGGSTKQVREQIDLALEHLIPAAPVQSGDGWRTMDSAPKDGTTILYLTKFDEIGFCYSFSINEDEVGCWWDRKANDMVFPRYWLPRSALPAAPTKGGE